MRRALSAIAVALLVFAACSSSGDTEPGFRPPRASPAARAFPEAAERPNVLIVMTDDQRSTTLKSMPKMRKIFQKGGTEFTHAYATTPVCCPSRASIMTGWYAHNHGVLSNGQVGEFDQSPTLQRYLKEQGYFTGVAGKFLNLWDVERSPDYFDRWAVMEDDYDRIYYDFTVNMNGTVRDVHDRYSTTWLGDSVDRWLGEFEEQDDDRPWYVYLAPFAPHQPATPEPKYANSPVRLYRGNPALEEQDRSDKSIYVQNRTIGLNAARKVRRVQLRTLPSVDDMVESVFDTLKRYDEDRDTLAIFMSDNGHMWGEHHLASKRWPYTDSIEIPLLLRWPGHVKAGGIDNRLVANIDVLPTVLDALGVWPDEAYPADGRSMLEPGKRKRLLLENWFYDHGAPTWAATLTKDYEYIEYYEEDDSLEFTEYYNLRKDPYQLENLLYDRDSLNDPDVPGLSERLAKDRECPVGECP